MAQAMEFQTSSNSTYGDGIINTTFLGQTFTIGTTGVNVTFNVSSVDLKLSQDGSAAGDLTIKIYDTFPDGKPSGAALSTGTILQAVVQETAGGEWYNVTMSSATLKASTKYFLEVRAAAGSFATEHYEWATITTAGYSGGQVFFTSDSGATWTADSTDDLAFQIKSGDYAGTLCTLSDARNKGGKNASTESTSEPLVSDFVRQAEGIIDAITRFKWVDAYASITTEKKFILNQVASDLAAIYIINYDMSAYTTATAEAETMLNIYRESVARGLSLLRNQEIKDFIIKI